MVVAEGDDMSDNSERAWPWSIQVAAFLFALIAAGFTFTSLVWHDHTDCFYESVDLEISQGTDRVLGCQDRMTFRAVNAYLVQERAIEMSDPDHEIDEPDLAPATAQLAIWIALFTASAGLAGYTFIRGIDALLSKRRIVRIVVSVVVASGIVFLAFWFLDSQPFDLGDYQDMHGPWIGRIAIGVGILVAPALAAILANWPQLRTPVDLDTIASVGKELRSMVGLVGATLALAVITTGARQRAIEQLPGADALPSEIVLIWGAVFALALTAIYVPVHQRWASAMGAAVKDEITEQFAADTSPGKRGYRVPELRAKTELRAALGAKGALATIQGSFSVLAPVIAAAVSSLFSS